MVAFLLPNEAKHVILCLPAKQEKDHRKAAFWASGKQLVCFSMGDSGMASNANTDVNKLITFASLPNAQPPEVQEVFQFQILVSCILFKSKGVD